MKGKLASLLNTACSGESSKQVREAAFLQLMLLVEKRHQIISGGEGGAVLNGRDEDIEITDLEEANVVARVADVLRAEEENEILCAAASVLGASRTPLAVRLLFNLIRNSVFRERFPVLHAAVANIDSLSFFSGEEPLESAFKELPIMEVLTGLLPTGNLPLDDRIRSALKNMNLQ